MSLLPSPGKRERSRSPFGLASGMPWCSDRVRPLVLGSSRAVWTMCLTFAVRCGARETFLGNGARCGKNAAGRDRDEVLVFGNLACWHCGSFDWVLRGVGLRCEKAGPPAICKSSSSYNLRARTGLNDASTEFVK